MPRNPSGTYTLPVGNPVAPGTTIESNWANDTMTDLANAMTDSLSRTGNGGLLVPFRVPDGTAAAPSLSFLNNILSGIYLFDTNDVRVSINGVDLARFQGARVQEWTGSEWKNLFQDAHDVPYDVSTVGDVLDAGAAGVAFDPSGVSVTDTDVQSLGETLSNRTDPSTETTSGIIEIADNAEALAHTDLTRAMNSTGVFAAFSQYGLGLVSPPVTPNNDFNDAPTTGIFRSDNQNPPTLNTPSGGASEVAVVLNAHYSSTYRGEIGWTLSGATPQALRLKARERINGAYGDWAELWHSQNVITGSNANGYYRIYPDGFIDVWKKVLSTDSTTVTFPVEFSDTDSLVFLGMNNGSSVSNRSDFDEINVIDSTVTTSSVQISAPNFSKTSYFRVSGY